MQIPDEIRKLITFVRTEAGGNVWVGTGFFVSEPVADWYAGYIVTCRHCVDPPERDAPVSNITVRLNLRAGGSAELSTTVGDWLLHPESDVAIYPAMPDRRVFDYEHYHARPGATAEFIRDRHVRAGEDVFMTGLLTYHPGETRMLPIIRVGNIAAFPEDRVLLRTGTTEHVILVETRSIAGLSGSPVFIHFGDWRRDEEGHLTPLGDFPKGYFAGPNWLMGIMHGVYMTEGNDPDGIGDAVGEPLNTGIGVVIPIERVHELLDHPTLREQRDLFRKKRETGTAPAPTAAERLQFTESTIERPPALLDKLRRVPKDEANEVHWSHDQS